MDTTPSSENLKNDSKKRLRRAVINHQKQEQLNNLTVFPCKQLLVLGLALNDVDSNESATLSRP